MTSVVGYAFNADTFCLECTQEYVEEKLRELTFSSGIEYDVEDMSLEKLTTMVTDSEGNDLHAMFDIDEQLGSDATCSCGETILEKTGED